jgi:hypothetical protein
VDSLRKRVMLLWRLILPRVLGMPRMARLMPSAISRVRIRRRCART